MTDPVLTRCPYCQTSFRLQAGQLEAAGGLVRCGQCLRTFSGADHLLPEPETPAYQGKAQTRQKKEELLALAGLENDEALLPLDAEQLAALQDEALLIEAATADSRLRTIVLLGSNLLLLLLLALQFAWFNAGLVSRSWLAPALCPLLACPPGQSFELARFNTLALNVQSHPEYDEALRIDFIFRNNAEREQAFPRVELNFMDRNNNLIANRLFNASEYLPAELQELERIPANTSVQARLDIRDPGVNAVNYSLALRSP